MTPLRPLSGPSQNPLRTRLGTSGPSQEPLWTIPELLQDPLGHLMILSYPLRTSDMNSFMTPQFLS